MTHLPTTDPLTVDEILALSENYPVQRTLCLTLSDDRSMPLQCRFKLGHIDGHDWEIEKNPLTDFRVKQLREEDSPSGLLPVRVPGAALREQEESSGVVGPAESERAAESNVEREVLETWTA